MLKALSEFGGRGTFTYKVWFWEIMESRRILQQNLSGKLLFYVRQKKYEFLLGSFILLIFGDTFYYHIKIFDVLNIYQNMFMGLVVFSNRKRLRLLFFLLILLALALDLYRGFYPLGISRSLHTIIYLVFFSLVSFEIYKAVLYAKTVTRELLSAAMCGFVLLCLISTFLFSELESNHPHSFSNLGGHDSLTNLNYFSFVTVLTIGYGDIVPLTLVARRAVMLISLASHIYTVFITSIIIGKYLSAENR